MSATGTVSFFRKTARPPVEPLPANMRATETANLDKPLPQEDYMENISRAQAQARRRGRGGGRVTKRTKKKRSTKKKGKSRKTRKKNRTTKKKVSNKKKMSIRRSRRRKCERP